MRAAVQDVAGLHEHRGAAHPSATASMTPASRKDRLERRQVAVHVADGDEAGWRLSGRQADAGKKQERGEDAFHRGSATASDPTHTPRQRSPTAVTAPAGAVRGYGRRVAVVERRRPERLDQR